MPRDTNTSGDRTSVSSLPYRWIVIAAALAALIGGYWFVAWIVGIASVWSMHSLTMKTNMALSLVLASLALVALVRSTERSLLWWAGFAISIVVLVVGALTLGEHIFGWNLGIDHILAVEPPGAVGATAPNRMGMPGSISLTLLGVGLLSLAFRRKAAAAYLGIVVLLVVLVPAVGYLYGIAEFYRSPGLTVIAWPTIVALLSLATGLILACADRNPISILFRDDAGGTLLRRMLPAAFILPLVLGLIRTIGEHQGLYDAPTGRGILVLSMILIFSVLLWLSAVRLTHLSELELEAKESLRRSEEQRRAALDAAKMGTWDHDLESGQVHWDERFREICGVTSEQMPYEGVINNVIHPEDRQRVDETVKRALDPVSGGSYSSEYRIVRPDKSISWIAAQGQVYFAPDGDGVRPIRFIGTAADITERKQSEEALRQSETRLRAIVDYVALGIVEADREDCFIAVNDRICDILGYSRDEILGMCIRDLTYPQDRGRGDELYEQLHSGRIDVFDYEKRYIRRDGTPVWVHVTVSAVRDSAGNFLRSVGTVEDITDRKRNEEALRASEARFRALVTASSDIVYRTSPDWSEMLELFGRNAIRDTQSPSQTWLDDYVHPDDQQRVMEAIQEAIRTKSTYEQEHRVTRLNGSIGWLMSRAVPMLDANGEIVEWFGTATDITDRRHAEDALRESEEKFRAVFEQAAVGMGRVSFHDARWIDVNAAFSRMLGYTKDELKATPWPLITHPDDVGLDLIPFQQMAAGQTDSYSVEKRFFHKQGKTVWARLTLSLVRDAEGEPSYEIAVIEDITDRKRAEDEVKKLNAELEQRVIRRTAELQAVLEREQQARARAEEGEAVLKALMEYIPEGVTIADAPDVNIRMISRYGLELTGRSADELMHIPVTEHALRWGIYGPDGVTLASNEELPLTRATQLGEAVIDEEYILVRPDGTRKTILCSAGPIRDHNGHVTGGVIAWRDITGRKQQEQELTDLKEDLERRTKELEEANRELEAFSYSVSHDLRAPLRAIDGFSSTLLRRYRDSLDPQGQDYLDRVRAAAQRMAQLIDDILGLSRAGRAEIRRQSVDVSAMASEILAELRESQPERDVEIVIQTGLNANADSRLLRIVFDNLLGNAWKFTSKQATPRIEVGSMDHAGERVYYVRDNGAGFNPERADKLFAPFQRLHSESDFPGTGIGLALVQRIIRRHGGRIWAEGEVDRGATFYFTLGEADR